jgi:hypothetical protein
MEKAGTTKIGGLPWQQRETWEIRPTDRLAAKVLCTRHNQAVSPLDAEAGRFIETIGAFDRGFNQESPHAEIALFCGEELEKWMLKTVCGMAAAGQLARGGDKLKLDVPDPWVSILSGESDWPPMWGLYAAHPAGVAYHSSSFLVEPITGRDTEEILAVRMAMNGVTFHLLLGRPDNPAVFGIYRPRTLIFRQDEIQKFAEISWHNNRFQQYLMLTRVGTYDGPSPAWPYWAQGG